MGSCSANVREQPYLVLSDLTVIRCADSHRSKERLMLVYNPGAHAGDKIFTSLQIKPPAIGEHDVQIDITSRLRVTSPYVGKVDQCLKEAQSVWLAGLNPNRSVCPGAPPSPPLLHPRSCLAKRHSPRTSLTKVAHFSLLYLCTVCREMLSCDFSSLREASKGRALTRIHA